MNRIEELTGAVSSLKENNRFHYFFETALAVGNDLNGTGSKGGAWGFKLDSIDRMEEVKSEDSQMNAAFYVIKEVWKKYTYPLFTKEELERYQMISKLPTSQISADLKDIKMYQRAIEKALKSHNK